MKTPKMFENSLAILKPHLENQAFRKLFVKGLTDHAAEWNLSQESGRPTDQTQQNPVPRRPVSSNLPLDISSEGLA